MAIIPRTFTETPALGPDLQNFVTLAKALSG